MASPTPNSAKPRMVSRRASLRRSSATATGEVTNCVTPVTSITMPMASGPCPRTKARNTGIR